MLAVNFDPELDKLLREVHDLLLMPSLPAPIPERPLALYERSELFRQQIAALELVAEMHNNVAATILPVESGLLLLQLGDVDACLRRGIEVREADREGQGFADHTSMLANRGTQNGQQFCSCGLLM